MKPVDIKLDFRSGAPIYSQIVEQVQDAIIGDRLKILDELAEIQHRIAEYLEILGSDKVLRDLIVKELKEVQKEYGDERRTQIIDDAGEIRLEDLVAVEDTAVTVTRGGYLKRTSVDTYRRQTRGGKGRIGMGDLTDRTWNLFVEAYELRKAVPCPMDTGDAMNTMVPISFMLGTQECYDFYRDLFEELTQKVALKQGVVENEKYRLLWGAGLPFLVRPRRFSVF